MERGQCQKKQIVKTRQIRTELVTKNLVKVQKTEALRAQSEKEQREKFEKEKELKLRKEEEEEKARKKASLEDMLTYLGTQMQHKEKVKKTQKQWESQEFQEQCEIQRLLEEKDQEEAEESRQEVRQCHEYNARIIAGKSVPAKRRKRQEKKAAKDEHRMSQKEEIFKARKIRTEVVTNDLAELKKSEALKAQREEKEQTESFEKEEEFKLQMAKEETARKKASFEGTVKYWGTQIKHKEELKKIEEQRESQEFKEQCEIQRLLEEKDQEKAAEKMQEVRQCHEYNARIIAEERRIKQEQKALKKEARRISDKHTRYVEKETERNTRNTAVELRDECSIVISSSGDTNNQKDPKSAESVTENKPVPSVSPCRSSMVLHEPSSVAPKKLLPLRALKAQAPPIKPNVPANRVVLKDHFNAAQEKFTLPPIVPKKVPTANFIIVDDNSNQTPAAKGKLGEAEFVKLPQIRPSRPAVTLKPTPPQNPNPTPERSNYRVSRFCSPYIQQQLQDPIINQPQVLDITKLGVTHSKLTAVALKPALLQNPRPSPEVSKAYDAAQERHISRTHNAHIPNNKQQLHLPSLNLPQGPIFPDLGQTQSSFKPKPWYGKIAPNTDLSPYIETQVNPNIINLRQTRPVLPPITPNTNPY